MKKELTDLFKKTEITESQNFNSIKITLASPELIIEHLDLKKMDYSVQEFSVQ